MLQLGGVRGVRIDGDEDDEVVPAVPERGQLFHAGGGCCCGCVVRDDNALILID